VVPAKDGNFDNSIKCTAFFSACQIFDKACTRCIHLYLEDCMSGVNIIIL